MMGSFGEFKELGSPYSEFEWSLTLYSKVDIRLFYDRSALDIYNDHRKVLIRRTEI